MTPSVLLQGLGLVVTGTLPVFNLTEDNSDRKVGALVGSPPWSRRASTAAGSTHECCLKGLALGVGAPTDSAAAPTTELWIFSPHLPEGTFLLWSLFQNMQGIQQLALFIFLHFHPIQGF